VYQVRPYVDDHAEAITGAAIDIYHTIKAAEA
jgi:hypothetical protein